MTAAPLTPGSLVQQLQAIKAAAKLPGNYVAHCASIGKPPVPASPLTLLDYLEEHSHLKPNTLSHYLNDIAQAHHALCEPSCDGDPCLNDPTQDHGIRIWKAEHREDDPTTTTLPPFTREHLIALPPELVHDDNATLLEALRCRIALIFWAHGHVPIRTSARLKPSDILINDRAVTIRHGKTQVSILATNGEACPVRHIRLYLQHLPTTPTHALLETDPVRQQGEPDPRYLRTRLQQKLCNAYIRAKLPGAPTVGGDRPTVPLDDTMLQWLRNITGYLFTAQRDRALLALGTATGLRGINLRIAKRNLLRRAPTDGYLLTTERTKQHERKGTRPIKHVSPGDLNEPVGTYDNQTRCDWTIATGCAACQLDMYLPSLERSGYTGRFLFPDSLTPARDRTSNSDKRSADGELCSFTGTNIIKRFARRLGHPQAEQMGLRSLRIGYATSHSADGEDLTTIAAALDQDWLVSTQFYNWDHPSPNARTPDGSLPNPQPSHQDRTAPYGRIGPARKPTATRPDARAAARQNWSARRAG